MIKFYLIFQIVIFLFSGTQSSANILHSELNIHQSQIDISIEKLYEDEINQSTEITWDPTLELIQSYTNFYSFFYSEIILTDLTNHKINRLYSAYLSIIPPPSSIICII